MRPLTNALCALLALVAAPLSSWAATCDYKGVMFPMQIAQAHPDLAAVSKAAGKAITQPAGEASWLVRDGRVAHLVVTRPTGGFWLLPKLDERPSKTCNEVQYSVLGSNPTIVRILTDDADVGEGCKATHNFWEHYVVDDASGRLIAHHLDITERTSPEPVVAAKGGRLSGNGELAFDVSLADLRACATPAGKSAKEAAMHWVNRGRKATKAKEYLRAVAYFDYAVAISSDVAAAHSGKGFALLERGKGLDISNAIKHFEAALERSDKPGFRAAVYYNLGLANLAQLTSAKADKVRRDHATRAREAFTQANALKPSKAAAGKLAEANKLLASMDADVGGDATRLDLAARCPSNQPGSVAAQRYPSYAKYNADKLAGYGASFDEHCKDEGRCGKNMAVFDTTPLQHDVVVRRADGSLLVFDGVFDQWSGAFCPWEPVFSFEHDSGGRYTLVTMEGQPWARWEGECSEEEDVIVDRVVLDLQPGAEQACRHAH